MEKTLRVAVLWMLGAVAAVAATFKPGDFVEVQWGASWYKAKVLEAEAARWKISYEGYGSKWDEWVPAERIRSRDGAAAATAAAAPATNGGNATAKPAPSTAAASKTASPAAATFPFPERPAGKTAGIQGAYLRVMTWFFNGRMSMDNEGWFFTADGRFSRSPVGGFNLKEFAAAKEARKSDGIYWLEGDKIVLTWASGSKPTTYRFARKKDGLELDGIAATPVEGFKKGWRVDAHYEGGATARGAGSFLASSQSLNLRRDGTFGFDAIGSVSVSTSAGSVGDSSSSSTIGTYEFDGYTLTLTHRDGRAEKATVFAFSDKNAAGAPEYLWRNGSMMRRRDPK